MIRPARYDDPARLSCSDPFFTRILSLYECYGDSYDFTGCWVQVIDGETVGAVSRFEDQFSVYLTDAADAEEITAFLTFQGARCVMTDEKYPVELPDGKALRGDVLVYRGDDYDSSLELYQPEIKDFYTLLQSCAGAGFSVPDYMMFLSDVTHRLNQDKCRILGTQVDGKLASALMTVSETSAAVILGAVATHPDFRRRGLSRELVRTLASRIRAQGREVYVFSAEEANTRFYERSGFEIIAGFQEKMR